MLVRENGGSKFAPEDLLSLFQANFIFRTFNFGFGHPDGLFSINVNL